LIEELKQELSNIREHLDQVKQGMSEAAEQAAQERLEVSLEAAKREREQCLTKQRDMLAREAEKEKGTLQRAVEEARQEADRWKVRLQECDELKVAQEAATAKEAKRAEALTIELAQVNEELAKSKRAMTGDELKSRLESLKEVVSHTLREKAALEEEVLRLQERLASQENRSGVIKDLQERLQTIKDMNARLDSDNEDLRMRLHTAQATLKKNHIGMNADDPSRTIRTPGGRKLGSSSRSSLRSSSGRKLV